jgi:hypothetical protein
LVNELTKYNQKCWTKNAVVSKCDMLDDDLKLRTEEELDVSF